MAKNSTDVELNDAFFETIGKSAEVTALTRDKADNVLNHAQASALVDTGAYRDGLKVQMTSSQFRNVARVVGTDSKTMLIESKTGNLARALRKVR